MPVAISVKLAASQLSGSAYQHLAGAQPFSMAGSGQLMGVSADAGGIASSCGQPCARAGICV